MMPVIAARHSREVSFPLGLLWPFDPPAEGRESNGGQATTFTGTCHCGAIRGMLHATKPAAELQVRSCQCGFCTRHGAMTVSDPAGSATFEIDRAALATYQFGTRTGTSLICRPAACTPA